ncbi:MAG TPA: AsmA-like C-terminal region-containing protein [Chitinophagaceae bacterium]|nr:DUF3971 domain-containing protein [Chitinophagaceae bacterium]MCC6634921.1 hypothetical protein [Chitinophagaceae bacterium]HMZ46256.1 AsmA-like C-terminal region-containing protein [Chitinophagaceae bacterium]HNE92899.1 AsmA-like C-terminal region-containing protein [Chitinophagaceae bacterium]HNF29157.1 AsmA-like C-terminal region-containing protein [Chitinophagaceae bacterium]
MKNKLGKIFKYSGISIGSILVLMFLLPYLFPGFVSDKIKKWANKSIESELNFSKARLSFFNHFPSLTLTLYDVNLKGSAPFKNDTLITANEIALGVDILSVFKNTLKIDEVYVTNGKIKILVSKNGIPNYNIYKSSSTTKEHSEVHEESDAALKLDRIQIENCALEYNDQSLPMLLKAGKVNYLGQGDLSKEIFDLTSKIEMQDFDFIYNTQPYLSNKNLKAQLITRINTHSLELDFQKNNLNINHLPIEVTGKLNFLSNGYSLQFNANTPSTKLKNLFTALPPAFVQWVDKTNVDGKLALNVALNGNYIKSKNQAPDLKFTIQVNNGSFSIANSNEPIKNIYLNASIDIPKLNTQNLFLKVDTLNATLGKNYLKGAFEAKNFAEPFIKGHLNVNMDLEKWNNILNIDSIAGITLKGNFKTEANFNGVYNTQKNTFPITNATIQWQNGYLKTKYYASAINNINIDATIQNKSGTTKDVLINVKPISFLFEEQPITVSANLLNLNNLNYSISSKGNLQIGKLYKLFAIDGYNINGNIKTDFTLQGSQQDALAGNYHKLNNKGTIELKDINLTTPYLPNKFTITNGNFYFNNDKLIANNVTINYLNNTAVFKGKFDNIINYLLQPNAALKADLFLNSNKLNVQDFMAFAKDSTTLINTNKTEKNSTPTSNSTGVILLPTNLNINFNAAIKTVEYNHLQLSNVLTNASIQNGNLKIHNADFNVIGSPIKMTAKYSPINFKKAHFTYNISATELDIQKAYKEIQFFRDMLTSAKKMKGLVSINYSINGLLNDSLYPILPTLKGNGTISIKNAKFYGFKLFNAISKKTNKDAIDNPDLSKHNIILKSKIANNIITIEKIKLRVAGFRPKFEGQVSLDGRLNLKARLGLPPFGIFGIPLSITGTQENPIVKFKRGKKSTDLEETEADEEDKKDAAEAEQKEQQQKNK